MGNKIVVISSDDWEGLYVNGKLEDEAHEIRIRDIAEHTPISSVKEFCLNDYGDEEVRDFGSLPCELSDIPSDWFYEDDLDDLKKYM